MRRRAIGLDIGTTAVRAVELSFGRGLPVVRRMGQVALPPGAVVAGEVAQPAIVSAALQRLWRAVGFRSRDVIVGIANARVMARTAELPALAADELRSSLAFHVADLFPTSIEQTELDYVPIEEHHAHHVKALVVAAQRDVLQGVLTALDGAGLRAERIDLVPLALVRSVYDAGTWLDGAGNDVVIGAGAGVTNVVVHRQGVVEFVRTLAGGGSLVTDAIASERRVDEDDAEAIKRGLVEGADADATARRALRSLVYEVATSIEFHLNLQDDSEVRQVTLAGGGARLATLRTMLEEQLGVPVVLPEHYHGVRVGKLHLDQNLVDGNGDVFSVALGLALGSGVDLLPKQVSAARTARRQLVGAGVATGLVVAGLAGVTVARVAKARDAEAIADRSEHDVNVLRAEVATYHDVATLQANVASRTQAVRTALQGDIAWTRVLQDVASAVPANAWLTTFNASHASVQITAKGYDQTAPAQWLQRAGSTGSLANVWLTTSTAYDSPVRPLVQFSSKATITSTSDRVADYLPGNR